MRKKICFFLFLLAANPFAFAQTQRIAQRSHSGTSAAHRAEGNFGEIGPDFSNLSKKQIDSMLRSDSIMRYWYDSIYRAELSNRAHAQQAPKKPKPGQGAAAGGATAIGIGKR